MRTAGRCGSSPPRRGAASNAASICESCEPTGSARPGTANAAHEPSRRRTWPSDARDTSQTMSQENVDLATSWYEVATSKAELLEEMARTMALCDPEVEWTAPEDGSIYRGREGVRRRLEEWLESFDCFRYDVQSVIECGGDQVLVEAIEVGRGAVSGVEARSTNYQLLTIRHGMITRIREFYDRDNALRAVGGSRD